MIDRRDFLSRLGAGALSLSIGRRGNALTSASESGETLYNGIRLSRPWPPRLLSIAGEPPPPPPYVEDPPAVIPIDVGRQLFVDDFLIEENLLTRTYHSAEYDRRSPILRPATRWERLDEYAIRTNTRSNSAAMVFSDGVVYDTQDRLFKMWYMGGINQNTCYATSDDGVSWTRPVLDIVAGTNIVVRGLRDSNTVWLDHEATSADERFKMASFDGSESALHFSISRDGIHWQQIGKSGPAGDRTTFFYNPFRKVWVFSIRGSNERGTRLRRYWETRAFGRGGPWTADEPSVWTSADRLDPRRPEYGVPAELYNLDAVAYESLVLGLFTMWRGEGNSREKPNDIVVGFSRDGFHWSRPNRRPFIAVSEHVGDWNWGNVQSAGGVCLVVGDRLHFYVSGRSGVPGTDAPGVCSTGLATLRRDGFASLSDDDSATPMRRGPAGQPRSVTTRPIRFSGSFLFVNADADGGEIRVEVLDRSGHVIQPFSAANCVPARGNQTRLAIGWNGGELAQLAGEVIRFRFAVSRARLFSFWVSPSRAGVSRGYTAAGGPGLKGGVDDGRV
jgi:hypothetical protein